MAELVGEVLDRKRGDTAPDVVLVLDPETGGPLNITGFEYVLTVNTERNPVDDSAQLVEIVGSLTAPLAGRVEFAWSPTNADQVPGRYWYDIEQTDTAGRVKTIAKNQYRIHQDITKN
jgi:hypothetical protein